MDVFGTVLEVRDRMCMAQQRVGKHDVLTAAELARRMGLRGGSARAFTVATLLEAACAAGATRRPLEPADLSKLGGGHSDEQELRWLADVNRARLAFPAADAAQLILERDEQLEHALSARLDPVWDGVSR